MYWTVKCNLPNKEPLQLRIKLEGEAYQRFMRLKRKLALENNTDLVRLMITRMYEEEYGKG